MSNPEEGTQPVYLISGELPGCGSTTVARELGERLLRTTGLQPEVIYFGERVRQLLGVRTEAELKEALGRVPDPAAFDAQIYTDIPNDRPVVIEGKLATQIGPEHIQDRPVHAVSLTVHPFQSAVRVMHREGTPYENMFGHAEQEEFVEYFRQISGRAEHLAELRRDATRADPVEYPNMETITIDTTDLPFKEVADQILGDAEGSESKSSDLDGVNAFAAKLMTFAIRLNGYHQNALDREHFEYNFKNLRYQLQRLSINHSDKAVELLQEDIRGTVIDSTFSLFMRSVPRFYRRGEDDTIAIDGSSVKWTPEFYKIAMAMPALKTILAGKTILDPFGGAGSLMFYLAAKEIPETVICSDICYKGGASLDDERTSYDPDLNQQSITALFASLPSWCRPHFDRIKGFVTADAMRLPMTDNAVDMIVGDPPYGVNCAQGSEHTLVLALPELLRVSREGILSMVPSAWVPALERSNYTVQRLTDDLSLGTSNLPTCYVHIR